MVASIALAAAENQINLVHVDQALAAVKAVAVAEVGTWIVLDRVRGIGMVLHRPHADCSDQDTNRERAADALATSWQGSTECDSGKC